MPHQISSVPPCALSCAACKASTARAARRARGATATAPQVLPSSPIAFGLPCSSACGFALQGIIAFRAAPPPRPLLQSAPSASTASAALAVKHRARRERESSFEGVTSAALRVLKCVCCDGPFLSYGATTGRTSALCTGLCPKGTYCGFGVSAPTNCPGMCCAWRVQAGAWARVDDAMLLVHLAWGCGLSSLVLLLCSGQVRRHDGPDQQRVHGQLRQRGLLHRRSHQRHAVLLPFGESETQPSPIPVAGCIHSAPGTDQTWTFLPRFQGRYGNAVNTASTCSGPAQAGYWTDTGATTAQQNKCPVHKPSLTHSTRPLLIRFVPL